MIKLKENSARAVAFKNAFRAAFASGKVDLHDRYKNPSQSKTRAYENLKDLYFDAKAVAVTSANTFQFTFMALYPNTLYIHTLNSSYSIALNDADFTELWSAV